MRHLLSAIARDPHGLPEFVVGEHQGHKATNGGEDGRCTLTFRRYCKSNVLDDGLLGREKLERKVQMEERTGHLNENDVSAILAR